MVDGALLIAPLLELPEGSVTFFKGIAGGIAAVWLLFPIFGIREMRKPSYVFDERLKEVVLKSGLSASFFSLVAIDLFLILSRLGLISGAVSENAPGYFMLGMLGSFLLSFGLFYKKG